MTVLALGASDDTKSPMRMAASAVRTRVTYISSGAAMSTPRSGKRTVSQSAPSRAAHCTRANPNSTSTLDRRYGPMRRFTIRSRRYTGLSLTTS